MKSKDGPLQPVGSLSGRNLSMLRAKNAALGRWVVCKAVGYLCLVLQ